MSNKFNDMSAPEIVFCAAVALLIYVPISILQTCFDGYVIHILWNWFVVPLGVVGIRTAQAIGLSLVGALIGPAPSWSGEDESAVRSSYKLLVFPFVRAIIALAVGRVAMGFLH